MNRPLVSIIVPTYNTEVYVEECIESLINQTYSNVEIIIVDDGSTDSTPEIIKKYHGHSNFQYILNKENKGQGKARNQGIKKSIGKYTLFVDSDDWIDANTVEELVISAEENSVDIIRFNGASFFEDFEGSIAQRESERYNFSRVLYPGRIYEKKELNKANRISYKASPCLYLIKKSILLENEICFLENIIHEDEYFTTKLFSNINTMAYINQDFYHRRYRPSSTMTTETFEHGLKSYDSYKKVFFKIKDLYDKGLYNPFLKGFLESRLFNIYNTIKRKSESYSDESNLTIDAFFSSDLKRKYIIWHYKREVRHKIKKRLRKNS